MNQSEEPAGSSTAPRPELNPLLNPLLAENMGRWAEVYFSTPPQHRDQAIRALLEELRERQSSAPTKERSAASVSDPQSTTVAPSRDDSIRCPRCGQENPRQYQFCGTCGGEMGKATAEQAPEPHNAEWQRWEDPGYADRVEEEQNRDTRSDSYSSAYDGLSILRLGSGAESGYDGPDFLYEPPPSHRYRVYLGLFLAIVIGALGYKAWKATEGNQNAYTPPPPPVSAEASPSANAPENPPSAEKTGSDSSTKSAAPAEKGTNIPAQKKAQASEDEPTASESASNGAAKDTADANQPAARPPRAVPSAAVANGTEELATAQEYLSRRNSAQAAPWLWKSVSKHNGQATLLLADLYLKGDGVSKNCDQARILLDSAARKGVSGAGERLRHLTAFGCQ